ncbi:MAG: paraquat-inducible protein A [Qingshengfaniella sp.]
MELGPDHIDGRGLIACPQCDALYRLQPVGAGRRARCSRCGHVLLAPRNQSVVTVVSLSLAALILMIVATNAPFLQIEASGLSSRASVIDAILAFSEATGMMAPLSLVIAALIVFLPALRLGALVYALGPLLRGHRPRPHAALMFRVAMRLRPWAMAEIFMIGVAVALIKIGGLAHVQFGPAFWAFAVLVLIITTKDILMCERSLWQILTPPARH